MSKEGFLVEGVGKGEEARVPRKLKCAHRLRRASRL